jgi:hypothetical protein
MSLPGWLQYPERYDPCQRCAGRGEIDCRSCNGKGAVVGLNRYLVGRTIGKRVGLKVCVLCRGSDKWRCGLCSLGSVPKR